MSDQASGKAEHGVAEEAAKPVASSAHFPRITKHDLEVVVEAMDKLRAALKAEEEEKPDFSKCSCHHCCQSLETNGKLACDCGCKVCSIAAPSSVDGLEAQCRKFVLENTHWNPTYENAAIVTKLVAFITNFVPNGLNPSVEYREVPGYSRYCVGSDGTIWTCWKQVSRGDKSFVLVPSEWKQISAATCNPYRQVHLSNGNGKVTLQVSTLVLNAFVGRRQKGQECRHLNGNSHDDCLQNLKWGTPKENADDRIKHGTMTSKLTEEQARYILAHGQSSARELAELFGVGLSTVYSVRHRKSWSHL